MKDTYPLMNNCDLTKDEIRIVTVGHSEDFVKLVAQVAPAYDKLHIEPAYDVLAGSYDFKIEMKHSTELFTLITPWPIFIPITVLVKSDPCASAVIRSE